MVLSGFDQERLIKRQVTRKYQSRFFDELTGKQPQMEFKPKTPYHGFVSRLLLPSADSNTKQIRCGMICVQKYSQLRYPHPPHIHFHTSSHKCYNCYVLQYVIHMRLLRPFVFSENFVQLMRRLTLPRSAILLIRVNCI